MELPIVLLALAVVLSLGVICIELLLLSAPRRGKRPDAKRVARGPRQVVKVVTPTGHVLTGAPERIVQQLARQGFPGAPRMVEPTDAWKLLDGWRAVGRIQLQIEWV